MAVTRVFVPVTHSALETFRQTMPTDELKQAQVQNPARVDSEGWKPLTGEWYVDVRPVDGRDPAEVGRECVLMYVKKLSVD